MPRWFACPLDAARLDPFLEIIADFNNYFNVIFFACVLTIML